MQVERILFGKLVYSEGDLYGLNTPNSEVKPLSESFAVGVLAHEAPVLVPGHAFGCSQVATGELGVELKIVVLIQEGRDC